MCSKCFWLILPKQRFSAMPRYVAVILNESICRMKLSSCKFYKWILSRSNCGNLSQTKNRRHNFYSCLNSPFLDSNRTGPLPPPPHCPPPPLQPKLGLTNLIVNSPFTRNPNLEQQFADQLGNARKEYHGNHLKAMFKISLLQRFSEGSGFIVGSFTGWMPRSASSCCDWRFRANLRSRIRKWYKHIWGKVHGSHANT